MNERDSSYLSVVGGAALNEETVRERHGEDATDRAAQIIAAVRVARDALRGATTSADMQDRSSHLFAIMRNAARAALHAPQKDRAAIRDLARWHDETGVVAMIEDPSLLDRELE